MNAMRPMTRLTLVLIAMLLVVSERDHVVAAPRADLREPPLASGVARDREEYTEKILAVLEHRVADSASRVKAAEKLATLNDRQLRLMADRKSTRLNSSHGYISYAVFCLKKKKQQ